MTNQDYIIISILGLFVLYQILTTFIGKKKKGYFLIASLLLSVPYIFIMIKTEYKEEYYDLLYYIILGVFVFYMFISNLWKYLKKDISEYDFLRIEEEMEEINDMSELLRNRFVSTIELLHDGISFRDSEGNIFGSDRFIQIFGLQENDFTIENFEKKIFSDDIYQYQKAVEKTSKRNPFYNVKYRVIKDDNLIWISEVGKQIISNKKETFISIVKMLDIKLYPETEIEVLNGLPGTRKMFSEMQELYRKRISYNLVYIQLTNIPQINDKYGRDVGDLMMGEYLKKLRYNFIKDNRSLFRVSGINFGLLIKDDKKYEILVRALQGSGELLNLNMVFGGITQTIYPNIGISESPYEAKEPDKVMEEAKKALEISLKDSTNTNYCFYDRL